MSQRAILLTLLCLSCGAIGGAIAAQAAVPLPYLLGALFANAALIFAAPASLLKGYKIPEFARQPFIACIGLLIGAQVHLELIENWSAVIALIIAVTIFAPLAFAANYALFRKIGHYDKPTALFCAAPGGLIEAIELGTQSGAHIAVLTMQQFLRIVLVVTFVPLLISLWAGHPVGSAAGITGAAQGAPSPLWVILAIGVPGYVLGKTLNLPAGQLTGPLIVAALLSSSGLVPLAMPAWLIIVAQIVVGTALGLRFNGMSTPMLRRGIGLGILSVGVMLALAGAIAALLVFATGLSGQAALLIFAPGGVTEMSLIALSIAADPALVTLAHVYRIILTVLILGILHKRFAPKQ